MTPDEIAAIRRRRAIALDEAGQNLTVLTSLDDIPALLAEVERLTKERREWSDKAVDNAAGQMLAEDERDTARQQLAAATAEVGRLESMLDSALEHASHGWNKLEQEGYAPHSQSWPPSTKDTIVVSGPYHIAAMIGYVKRAYDLALAATPRDTTLTMTE